MLHGGARFLGFGFVLGSLILLTGCSEAKVKVTGTVQKNGKALPIGNTSVVQVTLVPDVAADATYTSQVGRCDADGKFEILDVKPGKYKVVVEHLDPDPSSDKLGGAFSREKTPISRQIDGKKPLNIDLSNPTAE